MAGKAVCLEQACNSVKDSINRGWVSFKVFSQGKKANSPGMMPDGKLASGVEDPSA